MPAARSPREGGHGRPRSRSEMGTDDAPDGVESLLWQLAFHGRRGHYRALRAVFAIARVVRRVARVASGKNHLRLRAVQPPRSFSLVKRAGPENPRVDSRQAGQGTA